VHATLTREIVNDYSLLYTWKGTDTNLKPILLLAHMDVVPVDSGTENKWTHPPFAGRISDGYIWGRGTMDDKVSVLGILEAVEELLEGGFQPRRTVYLAFGHDEEVGGKQGAAKIATLLKSRGVELEYTLDEGYAITDGILPGIVAPVAMIGIAEKGYLTLTLTVEEAKANDGCGHSSMPPPHTTIGILSIAIQKLEANQMPARITKPVRDLFDYTGPKMNIVSRTAAANLWLFGPVVKYLFAQKPSTNALIRTTTAVTMIKGGTKENVLPCKAEAVVNFRLLPGDSANGVIEHVRRTISDPKVEVRQLRRAWEASPVSDTASPRFETLQQTIHQVFPDVVVAPSLTIGGTDTKYYASLSDASFRFLPLWVKPEDTKRIHGTNERVTVDNYTDIIRFYAQLIRNTDALPTNVKR
jgi:carboxypeptidase PM20D1